MFDVVPVLLFGRVAAWTPIYSPVDTLLVGADLLRAGLATALVVSTGSVALVRRRRRGQCRRRSGQSGCLRDGRSTRRRLAAVHARLSRRGGGTDRLWERPCQTGRLVLSAVAVVVLLVWGWFGGVLASPLPGPAQAVAGRRDGSTPRPLKRRNRRT